MNEEVRPKKEQRWQRDQDWIDDQLTGTFLGISELDEKSASAVLKNCSKNCVKTWLTYISGMYGWDAEESDPEEFLKGVEKAAKRFVEGKVHFTRQDNVIMEEITLGECCCPLVRKYKLITPFPNFYAQLI